VPGAEVRAPVVTVALRLRGRLFTLSVAISPLMGGEDVLLGVDVLEQRFDQKASDGSFVCFDECVGGHAGDELGHIPHARHLQIWHGDIRDDVFDGRTGGEDKAEEGGEKEAGGTHGRREKDQS
jgi:hypothetical protein